jgi:hypothetical protein
MKLMKHCFLISIICVPALAEAQSSIETFTFADGYAQAHTSGISEDKEFKNVFNDAAHVAGGAIVASGFVPNTLPPVESKSALTVQALPYKLFIYSQTDTYGLGEGASARGGALFGGQDQVKLDSVDPSLAGTLAGYYTPTFFLKTDIEHIGAHYYTPQPDFVQVRQHFYCGDSKAWVSVDDTLELDNTGNGYWESDTEENGAYHLNDGQGDERFFLVLNQPVPVYYGEWMPLGYGNGDEQGESLVKNWMSEGNRCILNVNFSLVNLGFSPIDPTAQSRLTSVSGYRYALAAVPEPTAGIALLGGLSVLGMGRGGRQKTK